jgi:hypothetical protein
MYQVLMFNPHYDDQFFISHFIKGLKLELRSAVDSQVPDTLARAFMLARVQQEVLDDAKQKGPQTYGVLIHLLVNLKQHPNLESKLRLESFGKTDNSETFVAQMDSSLSVGRSMILHISVGRRQLQQ